MLTDLDRYCFDLNGYLVLKGALSPEEVADCNRTIDDLLPIDHGEWRGHVHGHTYSGGAEGVNLQQIYEAGPAFERLIDHPSWYDKVVEVIGGQGNFDGHHGPCFIDEDFVSLRGPGEAIGLHSGGAEGVIRCQYRYHAGRFHCGQINILMALDDIGPGDGATMVIPGSHKANLRHPELDAHRMQGSESRSVDGVTGAVEVHLQAGDALLFVDAINHGSAKRVNPGQRRVCIYRYGPSWGMFRHPYRPSEALLERLDERKRRIVWPHAHTLAPPQATLTA